MIAHVLLMTIVFLTGLFMGPQSFASEPLVKFAVIVQGPDQNDGFSLSAREFEEGFRSRNYQVELVKEGRVFRQRPGENRIEASREFGAAALKSVFDRLTHVVNKSESIQVAVIILAHGAEPKGSEKSHSILASADLIWSLDQLEPLRKAIENKQNQSKLALLDFSCFSGTSRYFAGPKSCVVAGAPDRQVGIMQMGETKGFFSMFANDFAKTPENNLVQLFSQAREKDKTTSVPLISAAGFHPQSGRFGKLLQRALDYNLIFFQPLGMNHPAYRALLDDPSFHEIASGLHLNSDLQTTFKNFVSELRGLYSSDVADGQVEIDILKIHFQKGLAELSQADEGTGDHQSLKLFEYVQAFPHLVEIRRSFDIIRRLPWYHRAIAEIYLGKEWVQYKKIVEFNSVVRANSEQVVMIQDYLKTHKRFLNIASNLSMKIVPQEREVYRADLERMLGSRNACQDFNF